MSLHFVYIYVYFVFLPTFRLKLHLTKNFFLVTKVGLTLVTRSVQEIESDDILTFYIYFIVKDQ